MKDTSIPASTQFQLKSRRNDFETNNEVRIYPYSPGRVSLQIRGKSVNTPAYASAYLGVEQLTQLRDLINDYLKNDALAGVEVKY